MIPILAVVALHPWLLEIVVVLLLDERRFRKPLTLDIDIPLDGVEARVTPRISSSLAPEARHLVEYLSALDATDATVAVKRRWFERQSFNAACTARTFCRVDHRPLSFLLKLTSARLTLTLHLFLVGETQGGEMRTDFFRSEALH